jgi:hypothetical protein
MKETQVFVLIKDTESPEYNFVVVAPEGVASNAAATIVDESIARVKEANPGTYTFEELAAELVEQGFFIPRTVVTASERW